MNIVNQCFFRPRTKIVFVNRAEWLNYLSQRCFLKNRALVECQSERLLTAQRVYANAAKRSLVGSIMNQVRCSVFRQKIGVGRNVLEGARRLSAPDHPVNICISGGSTKIETSTQHFQRVVQSLRDFKEQLSIFWGQKDGGVTSLLCDTPNRVVTICHDGSEIKKLADLNQVYQEVHIADGHEVLFGEEHLPIVNN